MKDNDLELIVDDIRSCPDCKGIVNSCKHHKKMLDNDRKNTRWEVTKSMMGDPFWDLSNNWDKFNLVGWCFTYILFGYFIPTIIEGLR